MKFLGSLNASDVRLTAGLRVGTEHCAKSQYRVKGFVLFLLHVRRRMSQYMFFVYACACEHVCVSLHAHHELLSPYQSRDVSLIVMRKSLGHKITDIPSLRIPGSAQLSSGLRCPLRTLNTHTAFVLQCERAIFSSERGE